MKSAANKISLALLALASLFALACVTINVYFPEEKVKDLSEKIEDAVAREAAEAAPAPAEPQASLAAPRSFGELAAIAAGNLLRLLPAGEAAAQEVADPGISNPAIRRIIESRAARIGELSRFKASGAIGENNKALLEARDLQQLQLADRAAAQKLIKAENDDREAMFKEIAAATGASPDSMPQIRTTYAETLRQKAKAGEWIQQPGGEWVKK
jgi:uncharacterized protein YdbL (DUF1318 family)